MNDLCMRWTEDRLRTKFTARVREELQAEGENPDVRPTREWLRDHGYSGIEGYARRNDMTVSEVLEEICGFEDRPQKSLGIRHAETRRHVEEWIDAEQNVFNQWDDSRVADAQTHFRTLANVADDAIGTTNLLRLCRAPSPEDADLIMKVFSALSRRLESQGAQSNYTRSLERWARFLSIRGVIDDHQIAKIRDMMGYTYERKSPEHTLQPHQMRKTWQATEDSEEQTLVILLGASGTRRAEPTDIEVDDLRLDREDPYIVFDEDRKTDAATVPIMAGAPVIENHIKNLKSNDDWDGKWLFPSKQSEDGSRSSGWVNSKIEDIVDRAGVEFPDGEQPKPKSFRQFWYNHYTSAQQAWLAQVEMVADEQGVDSAKIVDLHYLNDKGARDHFRRFAESYFEAAFGEEMVHGIENVISKRTEERDEVTQRVLDDYRDTLIQELQPDDDDDNPSSPNTPTGGWLPGGAMMWAVIRFGTARVQREVTAIEYDPRTSLPSAREVMASTIGTVALAAVVGVLTALSGVNPLVPPESLPPVLVFSFFAALTYIIYDTPDLEEPVGESL